MSIIASKSLLAVLALVSCWLGARAISARSLQDSTDYGYYDRLRSDPELLQEAESSNESKVFRVVSADGQEYRLADVSGFLPFSDEQGLRAGAENEAIASLLAVYHFNHPEKAILDTTQQAGCNVRLTTELIDTQFSPINTTRKFTDVLLRNHSLLTPLPAAVVGAYRSATTSPLAILTGVNEIPQVSYAATSADFEVKEQYPLFGRTVSSSMGEANIAIDFFLSLGATHVAILFVTDSYGSALQKAFQDAAVEVGITTASVAFSYTADPNGTEMTHAVDSIASTQYRHIYSVFFDSHYEPIMTAAYERGLTGGDYLWIFSGLDKNLFTTNSRHPPDSPLAKASKGVGLLLLSGGFVPEISNPDSDVVYPLQDKPVTGFERLRTAWREAVQDPDFVAYARSKLPPSLAEMEGFDPNLEFSLEPSQISPLVYDAFIGIGISMCLAGEDTEFFTGPEIYDQFRNETFEGASGTVQITPETGTRNFTTVTTVMWNVQEYDKLDAEGNVQFQLAPTEFFQNGNWFDIPGIHFTYGNGGFKPPDSLPPVHVDMNYIGRAGLITAYVLMGIVMVLALASLVWLFWYRKNAVVSSAQPLFLVMVSVGTFVMASAVVPMSLQEPVPESGLDAACIATPWLYLTGAVIAFSPLFAKTRGIHMAYSNPELDYIHVSAADIFLTFGVVFSLNFVVLLSWTLVAPLEWTRTYLDSTDKFDRYIESYGGCSNADALPFVIIILVLNIGFLLLANWYSFKSRNIETEYQESRYIGITMAAVLQAWCMGVPIMVVVWDNPSAKFFVTAGIVFVTALSVLLLIYVPKYLQNRSRRNQFQDDDKDDKWDDSSDEISPAAMPSAGPPKDSITTGETASTESKPAGTETSIVAAAVPVAAGCHSLGFGSTVSSRLLGASGAVKSDEVGAGVGGIKVLRNPGNERKLSHQGPEVPLSEEAFDEKNEDDQLPVQAEDEDHQEELHKEDAADAPEDGEVDAHKADA